MILVNSNMSINYKKLTNLIILNQLISLFRCLVLILTASKRYYLPSLSSIKRSKLIWQIILLELLVLIMSFHWFLIKLRSWKLLLIQLMLINRLEALLLRDWTILILWRSLKFLLFLLWKMTVWSMIISDSAESERDFKATLWYLLVTVSQANLWDILRPIFQELI